jgi:hypothetical protein
MIGLKSKKKQRKMKIIVKLMTTILLGTGVWSGVSVLSENITYSGGKNRGNAGKNNIFIANIIINSNRNMGMNNKVKSRESEVGIGSMLSIMMIIAELFYSSIILIKENLFGEIFQWYSTVSVSKHFNMDKYKYISSLKESLQVSEETWTKIINNVNLEKCKNYEE